MRIGIGCTSYKRPSHLTLWKERIEKNTIRNAWDELYWHIEVDTEGVARAKNKCLRALKECDYIFLFDDDTLVKPGWIEFFLNAHQVSKQHHFLYTKETNIIKKIGSVDGVDIFNNCSGCMLFLTKEVINKVGAFNPNYGIYGLEHAGYSNRIHAAGLTPLGKYLCPVGASEFIHSLDLDGNGQFNIQHYPSLVNKIYDIDKYINQNRVIFASDKQIYWPL